MREFITMAPPNFKCVPISNLTHCDEVDSISSHWPVYQVSVHQSLGICTFYGKLWDLSIWMWEYGTSKSQGYAEISNLTHCDEVGCFLILVLVYQEFGRTHILLQTLGFINLDIFGIWQVWISHKVIPGIFQFLMIHNDLANRFCLLTVPQIQGQQRLCVRQFEIFHIVMKQISSPHTGLY